MTRPVPVLSAENLAKMIPDGSTIALAASGIFLEADALYAALETSFLETGHPRDLTLVHALGIGDGKGTGLGRFAHEGMVKRVIGGHWSWSPAMQRLAAENKIEAYSFPGGVISSLLREIGAGLPGLITRIGLGTFADPRVDGGRCNERAAEDLVEHVSFDGRDHLRYKPLKIDFALIRASDSDERGTLSLLREPTDLDAHAAALAAHNSGGKVFAQVERMVTRRAHPARLSRIPGILVDGILLAPDARKTYLPGYDPRVSGAAALAPGQGEDHPDLPTGIRRIIAERAMQELGDARSVNFGFGIPGGIPALVKAAGDVRYWGSVEQGIHNGAMIDGPMFGAAFDPDSIIPSVDQFDFYSGGGIDVAFLGMGEMDEHGNVNVSKIGGRLVGPGGFVDITQTARKVVFCGAFEAKGLDVEITSDGKLHITSHGAVPKLVKAVEHITFSGRQALLNGQTVLYVTERAVFKLTQKGVALIEVAPGIDRDRDVLSRMEFTPVL
jgi:acyl CoA:acetate/3-ketoacid CoA transferase